MDVSSLLLWPSGFLFYPAQISRQPWTFLSQGEERRKSDLIGWEQQHWKIENANDLGVGWSRVPSLEGCLWKVRSDQGLVS